MRCFARREKSVSSGLDAIRPTPLLRRRGRRRVPRGDLQVEGDRGDNRRRTRSDFRSNILINSGQINAESRLIPAIRHRTRWSAARTISARVSPTRRNDVVQRVRRTALSRFIHTYIYIREEKKNYRSDVGRSGGGAGRPAASKPSFRGGPRRFRVDHSDTSRSRSGAQLQPHSVTTGYSTLIHWHILPPPPPPATDAAAPA